MINVNIRSINANIDELLVYLKNDSYFNLDLIALTETWHNPDNCIYDIPGYNLFYWKNKRNQNDGIIIFAKQHLVIDFHEYDFCEANIIKLMVRNYAFPVNIICTYKSPSGIIKELLTRLEEILLLLDKVVQNNTLTVLLGDMNINIAGNNNVDNNYLDLLSTNGFISLINIFTRIPVSSFSSCIDHIFIKYH